MYHATDVLAMKAIKYGVDFSGRHIVYVSVMD